MKTIYLIRIDFCTECYECAGYYTYIYGDVYASKEQAELMVEKLKKDKKFLKEAYFYYNEDFDIDILERDLIE